MQRCQDYIHSLEKERCKIQVFKRELPLCLELVTQAIETCKQQLSVTTSHEYNSNECSEDMPVLEEKQILMNTKTDPKKECKVNSSNVNDTKSDWLSSVQLWNSPTSDSKQDSPRRVVVKTIGNGGAFHPFKKIEKSGETTVLAASASSTAETGVTGSVKEEKSDSQRKFRRCWSAELHKRFLHALEQLGGSHVATPKQIRELMKVNGLTNDEVKSHLQKYRLHTRRPSPSIHNTTTGNSQPPQFLVVRRIWLPPEYATAAAPGTAIIPSREPSTMSQGDGVYAPVAHYLHPSKGHLTKAS